MSHFCSRTVKHLLINAYASYMCAFVHVVLQCRPGGWRYIIPGPGGGLNVDTASGSSEGQQENQRFEAGPHWSRNPEPEKPPNRNRKQRGPVAAIQRRQQHCANQEQQPRLVSVLSPWSDRTQQSVRNGAGSDETSLRPTSLITSQ